MTKGEAEIEGNPIEEPDDDAHDDGQRNSTTARRFHGEGDSDKDHDHASERVGQFCIEVNDIFRGVIAPHLDLPNITPKIIVTHLLSIFLFFLKDIGRFGYGDHLLLKSGGLDGFPFMKIPDDYIIKVPGIAFPEGSFGVNSPVEFETIIELKQGDPLERIVLGVEDLEIVNGIAASIPYLIVSNEGLPLFLADFRQKDVIRFMLRKGDDELVCDEGKTACQNTQNEQREGDTIKAYSVGLHGRDLVIPGEDAQAKKGCHQDAEGEDLQSNARNLIQVIKEDESRGSLVFEEDVHSGEKIDDQVDQNEGTHAEKQYFEEFRADISPKDFHFESSLSEAT